MLRVQCAGVGVSSVLFAGLLAVLSPSVYRDKLYLLDEELQHKKNVSKKRPSLPCTHCLLCSFTVCMRTLNPLSTPPGNPVPFSLSNYVPAYLMIVLLFQPSLLTTLGTLLLCFLLPLFHPLTSSTLLSLPSFYSSTSHALLASLSLQVTWESYSRNAALCKAIIHDRPVSAAKANCVRRLQKMNGKLLLVQWVVLLQDSSLTPPPHLPPPPPPHPPHNDTQHYTCRNHIRFYHPVPEVRSTTSPKSLIVCGTGAFYPNCTIMEDVSLGTSNHFIPHFGQLFCTPHMTMNPSPF